jgi:alpha-tubulin suppressor-like RCC1 family protein
MTMSLTKKGVFFMSRFTLHTILILLMLTLTLPPGTPLAAQEPVSDSRIFLPVVQRTPAQATSTPVSAIAAGGGYTCALTAAGDVKCWGANYHGQLGDGSTQRRLTPVDVMGLDGQVVALSAMLHTCAITTDNRALCWGRNDDGEVGDGTTITRTLPVAVTGLDADIVAIAPGIFYTCALTAAGGVKCWGDNRYGQLGDSTTENRLSPVDVVGLTDVVAIATDELHTCALTATGSVKCWGGNDYGQLGNGVTGGRQLTPVDVVGLEAGVTAIALGYGHSCALTIGGGVKCWGMNWFGQIGAGKPAAGNYDLPTNVLGLGSGVRAIDATTMHTCALTEAGGVKCWGANSGGLLGEGTTESDVGLPVDIVGLTSGVTALTLGGGHNCVLMADGGVKCWGGNAAGALGNGTAAHYMTPIDVIGLASNISDVVTGASHTCALTEAGSVKCWGWNSFGQLGNGASGTNSPVPVDVVGLSSGVAALSISSTLHTCALTNAGGVKCWGRNQAGQLGDGTTEQRTTPVDVVGLASGVTAVVAGGSHTCALTSAGGVKCWGNNYSGQLGFENDGSNPMRIYSNPVDVPGLTSGVSAIAVGDSHTCAVTAAGGVKCWGANGNHQLGAPPWISSSSTPVDVEGLSSRVIGIAAAGAYNCVLTESGGAKCWGGISGDGGEWNRWTPFDVTGLTSGVKLIAAGGHVCVLTTSGSIKCWGSNQYGQFGNGDYDTYTLIPVDGADMGNTITSLAAGGAHTCGVTTTGGVKCWGNGWNGQLGHGSLGPHPTPVDVIGLRAAVD